MLKRLFTNKIWLSIIIAIAVIAVIAGLLLGRKPQPDATATVEPTKATTPGISPSTMGPPTSLISTS